MTVLIPGEEIERPARGDWFWKSKFKINGKAKAEPESDASMHASHYRPPLSLARLQGSHIVMVCEVLLSHRSMVLQNN